MKDEVLQKALSADAAVIPRYDVVKPDGTKVAENVQLVLKNSVLTPGTPLNKQNLLSDSTSRAFDLDPTSSVPDLVLAAIRASVSYCPKIKINLLAGSTVYLKNTTTNVTQSYAIPSSGTVTVDVLAYGTYSIWGVFNGVTTTASTLVVDTTKLYTVDVDYYACTWKFTVDAEIGATITVRHSDGLTITGTVASNKTCSIILPKVGTYTAVGVYDTCNSATYTFNATTATEGTTNTTAMKWITATINVTTGSIITVTSGSITKGGTAAGGALKVWLPSTGTWAVTATLGNSVTTGSISATAYQNYTLALSYYVTYGIRIPLGNSSPTAAEYTDDAVGMSTGYTAWSAQKIFKDIKPCLVLNGTVQYYLNKTNLAQKEDGTAATIGSTTAGDVMVEVPKMGYRIYSDSSYLYVKITDNPNLTDFCYLAHSLSAANDCDKIYYGAYLAQSSVGKLYSISNVTPTTDITLANARTYAAARGTGYELVSFYPWTLLQCLYLIMYKNLNGQSALGMGYTGQTSLKVTGGANAKGPCFGETTGAHQMSFLNIEDFWGNLCIWLDGICTDASYNIKTAYNGFNDTGNSYPNSQSSGLTQVTQGFTSTVQGTNFTGFLPKTVVGSTTTYFCDNAYFDNSALCYVGGAYSATAAYLGPFSMSLNKSLSTSPIIGARLLYKHKEA